MLCTLGKLAEEETMAGGDSQQTTIREAAQSYNRRSSPL